MTWEPVDRVTLEAWMADALAERDDDVRAAWARIRIEPEKWRCSPWGDAGGGFWAVAIDGDEVVWFNDIEDGFNRGRFTERGVIDAYACKQDDFEDVLETIAQALDARAWARLRPAAVPVDLAGPGTIGTRQTTYWELRAASGAIYRVHFRGKQETRFTVADYRAVALVGEHPVLDAYRQPGASLYFAGCPIRPAQLAEAVGHAVRETSAGWRSLVDHGTGIDDVARTLAAGHGLLLRAPRPTCEAIAAVLEAAGVEPSIVGGTRVGPPRRLLLLGTSFLVADAFAFDRQA